MHLMLSRTSWLPLSISYQASVWKSSYVWVSLWSTSELHCLKAAHTLSNLPFVSFLNFSNKMSIILPCPYFSISELGSSSEPSPSWLTVGLAFRFEEVDSCYRLEACCRLRSDRFQIYWVRSTFYRYFYIPTTLLTKVSVVSRAFCATISLYYICITNFFFISSSWSLYFFLHKSACLSDSSTHCSVLSFSHLNSRSMV